MLSNFTAHWNLITTEVSNVSINGLDDVVLSVHLICTMNATLPKCADIGIEAVTGSSESFKVEFDVPNPEAFIEVSDVNKATILEWCFQKLNKEQIEEQLVQVLKNTHSYLYEQPKTRSVTFE